MTACDVVYRFGKTPDGQVMRALDTMREVYGIRKISFEGQDKVRVEYDASRVKDPQVANLLRGAGMDIREKVALV